MYILLIIFLRTTFSSTIWIFVVLAVNINCLTIRLWPFLLSRWPKLYSDSWSSPRFPVLSFYSAPTGQNCSEGSCCLPRVCSEFRDRSHSCWAEVCSWLLTYLSAKSDQARLFWNAGAYKPVHFRIYGSCKYSADEQMRTSSNGCNKKAESTIAVTLRSWWWNYLWSPSNK